MKIRIGFVSNSSTSSFMVIGKKFELTNKIKKLLVEKLSDEVIEDLSNIDEIFYDYDFAKKVFIDNEGGFIYVGYVLGVISSESYDEELEIGGEDIDHLTEIAKETLAKIGYPNEKLKLYGGTIAS